MNTTPKFRKTREFWVYVELCVHKLELLIITSSKALQVQLGYEDG